MRLALGAERSDVVRMIMGQGLRRLGIGISIGLLLSMAFTRLLRAFLYAVSPTDPLAFTAVTILLAGSDRWTAARDPVPFGPSRPRRPAGATARATRVARGPTLDPSS